MEIGLIDVAHKKHDAYIDLAKAIGIIMVVFAHINLAGGLYTTFYAFHIPLFFVIAGMTFNSASRTQSFKEWLFKKVKKLLLPYLIYSLVSFIWWACVEVPITDKATNVVSSLYQILLAQGSTEFLQHNPALWFIPCFFVVELLYFVLNKCRMSIRIPVVVALAIGGWCMSSIYMPNGFANLPWSIEVAFSALLFVFVGDLLGHGDGRDKIRKAIIDNKVLSIVALPIIAGLLYILSQINGKVSMGSNEFGNIGLFYLNAFLGVTIVIIASVFLEKALAKRIERHSSLLMWVGAHTFEIMAVHFPVKRCVVRIVAGMFRTSITVASRDLGMSIIAFVVTLAITMLIVVAAKAFIEAIAVREFKS